MASKSSDKTTAPARSEEIDVGGPAAVALGAAWRGVYHFFGGRVKEWEFVPPTEDNPSGGLVAHGFSVNSPLDPNQIISDIGTKGRRLEALPFVFYANGQATPPEFTVPQDMTNFGIQYLKGSVEDGTAKTPEYLRKAVADYKAANNMRTRRGPKRKIIRLDELANIDPTQLAAIDPTQLEEFLRLAQSISDANTAKANGNGANSETSTPEIEGVVVSES